MSNSDRGKRDQNLTTALGAFALFGCVGLGFAIGNTLGVNSGRDQITAREDYENAKQYNLRACSRREGAATVQCVSEAVEAAQEQSDSRQDLYAQQDMSRWAFWLLMLTVATFGVTAVGVWLVKRTLDETIKAVEDTGAATNAMVESNRIAREQFLVDRRPELVPVGVTLIHAQSMGDYVNFRFNVTFRNDGKFQAREVNFSQTALKPHNGGWAIGTGLNEAIEAVSDKSNRYHAMRIYEVASGQTVSWETGSNAQLSETRVGSLVYSPIVIHYGVPQFPDIEFYTAIVINIFTAHGLSDLARNEYYDLGLFRIDIDSFSLVRT